MDKNLFVSGGDKKRQHNKMKKKNKTAPQDAETSFRQSTLGDVWSINPTTPNSCRVVLLLIIYIFLFRGLTQWHVHYEGRSGTIENKRGVRVPSETS